MALPWKSRCCTPGRSRSKSSTTSYGPWFSPPYIVPDAAKRCPVFSWPCFACLWQRLQIVLEPDPAQAFYLLPYRGWELLLGGYLAVARLQPLSRLASDITGLAGFACIAYAAWVFNSKTPFPGLNALIPCLGAALLIAAGSQER